MRNLYLWFHKFFQTKTYFRLVREQAEKRRAEKLNLPDETGIVFDFNRMIELQKEGKL